MLIMSKIRTNTSDSKKTVDDRIVIQAKRTNRQRVVLMGCPLEASHRGDERYNKKNTPEICGFFKEDNTH